MEIPSCFNFLSSNFSFYYILAPLNQKDDLEIKSGFEKIYKEISAKVEKIFNELISALGNPVDIGGYCLLDDESNSSNAPKWGV